MSSGQRQPGQLAQCGLAINFDRRKFRDTEQDSGRPAAQSVPRKKDDGWDVLRARANSFGERNAAWQVVRVI